MGQTSRFRPIGWQRRRFAPSQEWWAARFRNANQPTVVGRSINLDARHGQLDADDSARRQGLLTYVPLPGLARAGAQTGRDGLRPQPVSVL
jgi:hypothetical protein